jgi:hypothetical protein
MMKLSMHLFQQSRVMMAIWITFCFRLALERKREPRQQSQIGRLVWDRVDGTLPQHFGWISKQLEVGSW